MRASVVGSRAHVGLVARPTCHKTSSRRGARWAQGLPPTRYGSATALLRFYYALAATALLIMHITDTKHNTAIHRLTSPTYILLLLFTVVYRAPPASPGGAQLPRNISSPLRICSRLCQALRQAWSRVRKGQGGTGISSCAEAEATSVHPDARAVTCAVEAQSMCFVNCE